jgi:hypothetical protein
MMILQVKPERWMCAATAFAMVLDIPVLDFIAMVGHDGSEIIFPKLDEPRNRRGHNIYDFIDFGLNYGITVTPVPLRPVIDSGCGHVYEMRSREANWKHFIDQIQRSRGVIECSGLTTGHMVGYDHGTIFDPDGEVFTYSREACEERGLGTYLLWRVDELQA